MCDLKKITEKRIRRIPDIRSCTKLDVLRRFYTILNPIGKHNIFVTASTVVSEIEEDVQKLNLYPKQRYYLRNKIIQIYKNFKNVQKNFKPRSLVQKPYIVRFYDQLSDPFLCTQEREQATPKRELELCLEKELDVGEAHEESDSETNDPNWLLDEAKSKVSTFVFISPNICVLLDSLGISSTSMSRLFLELKQLNNVRGKSSKSTVWNMRNNERQESFRRLHQFKFPNHLILHWDGKKMQNNSNDMVERLVISVSAPNGLQKLISCNFIEDGSGQTIANELKKQCEELKITHNIVGLSYDTTASNSGRKSGAAILFEKSISLDSNPKHLNRRPCRLHQKELCVANPFKAVVMKSVGAGILIFAQFRKWFNQNSSLKITPALHSKTLKPILEKNKQALIDFYEKQTKINHRRADHREVAELALVHLNANSNYKIKSCGADHHARWLSKVIYIFKILLFKKHFNISEILVEQFESMLIYFITVYLKYWFTCESTIYAPKNDLDFLTELHEFSQIEGKYFPLVASSAKSTQLRHMDYLTEENAIFSIFDDRISVEEKENLRVKLLGINSQGQLMQLIKIDPNTSLFSSDLEEDKNQISTMSVKENTEDFINLINTTDQMLYEKDFIEIEEVEQVVNNVEVDAMHNMTYSDSFFSKSPFDFITLQSLKTLVSFGKNISFMLFNAAEWADQKSFLNAIETSRNIQSTSIYTEQLVGKISRLNTYGLVKNRDNLNCLALSAIEKRVIN